MSDERIVVMSGDEWNACEAAQGVDAYYDQWLASLAAKWEAAAGDQPRIRSRITHGRHCTCSACAREDWTPVNLPCGMHGSECPNRYQPWGPAGRVVDAIVVPPPEQP